MRGKKAEGGVREVLRSQIIMHHVGQISVELTHEQRMGANRELWECICNGNQPQGEKSEGASWRRG